MNRTIRNGLSTPVLCVVLLGGCQSVLTERDQSVSPLEEADEVRKAPEAPASPKTAEVPEAEEVSPAPAPAEVEEYSNTIRWTTASEEDNLGFDVYRAESEEGPFERLNEELIEGGMDSDEQRDYAFVDRTIDPKKPYWYYVESVSLAGERERFTPVGRAGPKIKADSP